MPRFSNVQFRGCIWCCRYVSLCVTSKLQCIMWSLYHLPFYYLHYYFWTRNLIQVESSSNLKMRSKAGTSIVLLSSGIRMLVCKVPTHLIFHLESFLSSFLDHQFATDHRSPLHTHTHIPGLCFCWSCPAGFKVLISWSFYADLLQDLQKFRIKDAIS